MAEPGAVGFLGLGAMGSGEVHLFDLTTSVSQIALPSYIRNLANRFPFTRANFSSLAGSAGGIRQPSICGAIVFCIRCATGSAGSSAVFWKGC